MAPCEACEITLADMAAVGRFFLTCQAVARIYGGSAAYFAGVKQRNKPMSASIETRPRRSRHETEPVAEPVATDATDESATAETVTAKAEGIAYTLPRTAKAGDVHTDNSALVYDLAKARQFVSMMASKGPQSQPRSSPSQQRMLNAKRTRRSRWTTISPRGRTYVPEIAVRTGEGAVETMQDTATWNAWLAIVAEHDAA